MNKALCFRCFRWVGLGVAAVIIFVAILLNATRLLVVVLEHHPSFIEKWVSQTLHQPVQIGSIHANWTGLDPEITFQNVLVSKASNKQSFIKIQQLSVGIDVLSSLLQWKLLPGQLTIKGTDLNIFQTADNKLRINGISEKTDPEAHSTEFKNMLDWLLTEGNVVIDHVNVNWHTPDGAVYPVRHLRLKVRNDLSEHQMAGAVNFTRGEASPSTLRFVARLHDIDLSKSLFDADVFLQGQHIDLQRWVASPWVKMYIASTDQPKIKINQGMLDLKMWLTWKASHLKSVQSLVNAEKLAIYLPTAHKNLMINQLNANLVWHQYLDGWDVQADKIQLKVNNHAWPDDHFAYRVVYDQMHKLRQQLFYLDYLQLQELRDMAMDVGYWPPTVKRFFLHYQPQGILEKIRFQRDVDNAEDYDFSLQFKKLGLLPYQKYPGVQNIAGQVSVERNSGHVALNTKDAHILLPKFYTHPVSLDQMKLSANWQRDASGVRLTIPNYAVKLGAIASSGKLRLSFQKSEKAVIDLLATYHFDDLGQLKAYLPQRLISKQVFSRLTYTFKKGELTDGRVCLRGPIDSFPYKQHQGKFDAMAHFKNLTVDYSPGWPVIKNMDINVHLKNATAQANITTAQIAGNSISQIQATVPDIKNPVLKVSGHIDSNFSRVLDILKKSPLRSNKVFNQFFATGPFKLDINLTYPLSLQHAALSYHGALNIRNAQFDFLKGKITLNKIHGKIGFRNNSFYSSGLTADLFKIPLQIKLLTLSNTKHVIEPEVIIGGHLDIANLRRYFSLPKLKYVSGAAGFRALLKFHFPAKDKIMDATFMTNLNGIKIAGLPAYLDKPSNTSSQLRVKFSYPKKTPIHIEMDYDNKVSATMSLNHHFKVLSGEIYAGEGRAAFHNLPGFVIDGQMQSVDWSQWAPFIMPFIQEEKGAVKIPRILGLPLRYVEFNIGKATAFKQTLNNVYFKLIPRLHDWMLNIQNKKVAGILFFPSNPGGTWTGRFDHLYLPKAKKKSSSKKSTSKKQLIIDPRDIPAINVLVEHLVYGKAQYGQVSFIARPTKTGLDIKKVAVHSPLLNMAVKGVWQEIPKPYTSLKGYFLTKNLGEILESHGMKNILAKAKGSSTFSVSWRGAPNQFKLKNLNGKFYFNFKHGRLLKMGGKGNTKELSLGRLVNILSVQSLLRRLTLNFSDITAKGLEFNELKGDFSIVQGVATTQDTVFDGPVVKIKAKGKINFHGKYYDLDLAVRPYVTSSVPIIVGIVGGPIAGAVTWVVNKIVSPEIGRAMGFDYKARGSWDKTKLVKLPAPAVTS